MSSIPRCTSAGSARSICTWFLSPPGQGHSALNGWRDTVITRQPPALNFFTVAWPMPRLAPVSTRVRVLSSRGTFMAGSLLRLGAGVLDHLGPLDDLELHEIAQFGGARRGDVEARLG